MKKYFKIIATILISLIIIIIGLFGYNSIDKSYDNKLLSNLKGEILYLKRDTDLVLKLYKAKANLEDEQLIYSYNGCKDNNNILSFDYDEDRDVITFVAYDEEVNDWMKFELDSNSKVTPLNIQGDIVGDYSETVESNKYIVEVENGNLYITNKQTNKKELLKRHIGTQDDKFVTGYIPVKLSDDDKYLFVKYNGHNTIIGTILEGLIFKDDSYKMYVIDLETKKMSRYVDFDQILFIK